MIASFDALLRKSEAGRLIALTSSVAFALVVHPSLQVASVKELVQYVKERPGQLSFGSTGIGATPHLAFEMMMRDAGLKMTHVPYRGMPQAVNDVVGNHVQMVFADPAGAPPLIKDGKLRALAVSSKVRIAAMPDVPTMEEAGFPGFEAVSWHMIVGPAGMPKEIVDKLSAEFKRMTASPDYQAQVDRMGLLAIQSPSPDELKKYLDKEIASWGALVKDVGIAGTE